LKYNILTICVPAYNEVEGIKAALEGLRAKFQGAEIIVVDDGSTDETFKLAKSVEGVTVLSHSRNRGYGAALKTAIRYSKGEIIAWFDADGQHRPDDLEKIVKPVLENQMDMVIGARGQGSDVRMDRLPGKMLLKLVAELIVGESIPDLNSGLRCFKSEVIKRYLHLLPEGFSASTTSTLLMKKRGYRMEFINIIANKREGKSSVSIVYDGLVTLGLIIRILILFNALAFFTILGFLQVVAGILWASWYVIVRGAGFSVFASTLIISGALTLFMGLLCDQITELRKERLE
jgi:glycosyltransferase involved in cell wall biosynthesis